MPEATAKISEVVLAEIPTCSAHNGISEVRTDRIVRIDPAYVRRASGSVSAAVFQKVAAEVREHWDD